MNPTTDGSALQPIANRIIKWSRVENPVFAKAWENLVFDVLGYSILYSLTSDELLICDKEFEVRNNGHWQDGSHFIFDTEEDKLKFYITWA